MNQAVQKSLPVESEQHDYAEVTIPVLSERDATAFINSIRFPVKPNERLKEAMRKYRARS